MPSEPLARVGRTVPRNVYWRGEPLFVAATAELADEVVATLNAGAGGRAHLSAEYVGTLKYMLKRSRTIADCTARVGDVRVVAIYNREEAALEAMLKIVGASDAPGL